MNSLIRAGLTTVSADWGEFVSPGMGMLVTGVAVTGLICALTAHATMHRHIAAFALRPAARYQPRP